MKVEFTIYINNKEYVMNEDLDDLMAITVQSIYENDEHLLMIFGGHD